jgi:hypothetical protein
MASAVASSVAEMEDGNPLVGLAVAAIHAILYVLDQFKNLVTWCTITFPGYVLGRGPEWTWTQLIYLDT